MVGYVESTVSMIIQIIVLGLVVGALLLKTKKRYRQHGIFMLSALMLHIISILAVMIPSFAALVGPGSVNLANIFVMVTLVHISAGLFAALLGIWLVGSWRLKVDIQGCFRKKKIMDSALILWMLAIALGIFLYLTIVGVI
jgi:uncharacterized membrane protein YozB (DUF420 family)